jgi:hypothetical protein
VWKGKRERLAVDCIVASFLLLLLLPTTTTTTTTTKKTKKGEIQSRTAAAFIARIRVRI